MHCIFDSLYDLSKSASCLNGTFCLCHPPDKLDAQSFICIVCRYSVVRYYTGLFAVTHSQYYYLYLMFRCRNYSPHPEPARWWETVSKLASTLHTTTSSTTATSCTADSTNLLTQWVTNHPTVAGQTAFNHTARHYSDYMYTKERRKIYYTDCVYPVSLFLATHCVVF